jgi:thiol-disulfide isomerase/thioredoxin
MAKFPDLSFHQLTEGNGELAESLDEIQSLHAFRAGKVMVIDFWHTKCTRCPAALEKLNNMAESYADEAEAVMFVGCALSQGDGNKDIVVDMVDGEWENLTHIFISIEQKEIAKKALGFTAVPFVAVIGKVCMFTARAYIYEPVDSFTGCMIITDKYYLMIAEWQHCCRG